MRADAPGVDAQSCKRPLQICRFTIPWNHGRLEAEGMRWTSVCVHPWRPVLDLWFEREVKPRLRGEAHLVRYADDFVMTFELQDAPRT